MKKKNSKIMMGLSLAAACLLFMTGCGSAGKYSSNGAASAPQMAESAAYDSAAAVAGTGDIYMYDGGAGTYAQEAKEEIAETEAYEGGEGSEGGSLKVQDTARKLIRNVDLDVETEEFDTLMQTISDKTAHFGGYVETSRIYNGSYRYEENRNADLTLRIPAERLDEFLSEVAETSNVVSKNESVTDVTLQYIDMKSRKEALETEQKRLLELLEEAESIEDIISIEERLSEVRYQIESMESQLRAMDNQVTYSTVYLYIREVKRLTPVKEQTTWEKIQTGFSNSLYDVGYGIRNFFINVMIDLPYLVLYAVMIAAFVLLLRFILKARKKRKTGGQDGADKEQGGAKKGFSLKIKKKTEAEKTETEKK